MANSIGFYKFHGTLNDFVMINGIEVQDSLLTSEVIRAMCNRYSGVGADGLIILKKESQGLRMLYYNSDGNQSTMCGNGGRCFAAFVHMLGLCGNSVSFEAIDGKHDAKILDHHDNAYNISLSMSDVKEVQELSKCEYRLDTGSPHFVRITTDIDQLNVHQEGRKIRQSPPFQKEGINVNFIERSDAGIRVRTYERGVEDETKACGTGSVASAIVAFEKGLVRSSRDIHVATKGGPLEVSFDKANNRYSNIRLTGPAIFVFRGTYVSV